MEKTTFTSGRWIMLKHHHKLKKSCTGFRLTLQDIQHSGSPHSLLEPMTSRLTWKQSKLILHHLGYQTVMVVIVTFTQRLEVGATVSSVHTVLRAVTRVVLVPLLTTAIQTALKTSSWNKQPSATTLKPPTSCSSPLVLVRESWISR